MIPEKKGIMIPSDGINKSRKNLSLVIAAGVKSYLTLHQEFFQWITEFFQIYWYRMLRNIKLVFMADFQLQVVEIVKNFYPVSVT